MKWDVHQRKHGQKDTLGNSRLRKMVRDVGTLEQRGMSRKRERLSQERNGQTENLKVKERILLIYASLGGLLGAWPKPGEAGDPEVSPVRLVKRMVQTSGLEQKEVQGLPGAQGKEETGKQGSSSTLYCQGAPPIRPPHPAAPSCCFCSIARLFSSPSEARTPSESAVRCPKR